MDAERVMILLFFVGISLRFPSSNGYRFGVGGRDKWIIRQSHNEFLVNDSLYLQHISGKNCVLQVTKQNYDSCNTSNPLRKNENGSSEFKLDRPGPFYFISGVQAQCEVGQKLHVMVTYHHPSSASSPADGASPAPSPSENAPSDISVKDVILSILGVLITIIFYLAFMWCLDVDEEPNQPMGFTF